MTVQDNEAPLVVPFMHNIKSELVLTPQQKPRGFDKRTYPRWEAFHGVSQFLDPNSDDQVIAVWCELYGGCAFFTTSGFMKVNPNDIVDYKFVWNPKFDPFKPKKSKYSHLSNKRDYLAYCFVPLLAKIPPSTLINSKSQKLFFLKLHCPKNE